MFSLSSYNGIFYFVSYFRAIYDFHRTVILTNSSGDVVNLTPLLQLTDDTRKFSNEIHDMLTKSRRELSAVSYFAGKWLARFEARQTRAYVSPVQLTWVIHCGE